MSGLNLTSFNIHGVESIEVRLDGPLKQTGSWAVKVIIRQTHLDSTSEVELTAFMPGEARLFPASGGILEDKGVTVELLAGVEGEEA